jgi:peroxiredoxin Q/BCP
LRSRGIFGISADSVESHKAFAEKFHLIFPLLADTEKKVIEAYGVWGEKEMAGKKYMGIRRMSFLIDPEGKIAKIYEKVNAEEHPEEVLKDLENLQ